MSRCQVSHLPRLEDAKGNADNFAKFFAVGEPDMLIQATPPVTPQTIGAGCDSELQWIAGEGAAGACATVHGGDVRQGSASAGAGNSGADNALIGADAPGQRSTGTAGNSVSTGGCMALLPRASMRQMRTPYA